MVPAFVMEGIAFYFRRALARFCAEAKDIKTISLAQGSGDSHLFLHLAFTTALKADRNFIDLIAETSCL